VIKLDRLLHESTVHDVEYLQVITVCVLSCHCVINKINKIEVFIVTIVM